MKTAGIDVGFDAVKAVVMDGGKVIGKARGESGCMDIEATVDKLYQEALKAAGLAPEAVEKVVATGTGRFSVKFAANHVTDAVAGAKAARYFFADAVSVVDIGADQTRVTTLADEGIKEIVRNQKCMAGLGMMLDVMSDRLGYRLEEISKWKADAAKETKVNDGCPVFAELDALEELNRGTPREQVMAALIRMVSVRLNAILHDKVMPAKEGTVLLGGVSQNTAVIDALKARSGVNFIVPEDAVYGGAIGCALLAAM